jgi:protein TonB
MFSSRWLVVVPLSLALHGALALAIVAFVRSETLPPTLIIDLSAIVAGHEGGSATGDGAPAPPPTRPPARAAKGATARTPRVPPTQSRDVPASSPVVTPSTPSVAPPEATTPRESPVPVVPVPLIAGGSEFGSPQPGSQTAPAGSPAGVAGDRQTGGGSDPGATGPGGSGTGRTAALGVIGGTGGGGLGADYAAYLARLRQRIQDVLRYPPAARRRGVTGTVQLEIAIEPDGAIGAVTVIASSAHGILDRAAVEAARSVPRTPFPGDQRPRGLRVRLPVVFELQ